MPETLGNDMASFANKYEINYEKPTKTWRILDLKHPECIKIKNLDEDIPDDHPAITVIPELAFSKLIAEAIRLGVLSPSVAGIGSDIKDINDLKEEIKEKDEIIKDFESRLDNTEKEKIKLESVPTGSEKYKLKSQIVSALKGIAIAEDINEIK